MHKKTKAASSSRAQAGAFGASAFGGDSFVRSSSTFASSFGAVPASQLSYVYEPSDLSTISDSTVVVAWKNLQKKDSTTKTKALDDLLAYVSKVDEGEQTIEDGFLDAWIKLYARTSIDNARQVRQRSHTLQGRIAAVLGKRIAKSLPSLIGPWLSGLHDTDKLVIRSTQESLAGVFPSDEKRLGLWKIYHGAILEYCSNAILHEDVKTLSDERTTNTDDAESKYTRTIGSAVLTVARALEVLDEGTIVKQYEQYKELLDSDKLWLLAESPDPFLRQAVYKITTVRLDKLSSSIDAQSVQKFSKALIGKGLRKDQAGSLVPFVALLNTMTKKHPGMWTTHFAVQKRTASDLLDGFLKKLPAGMTADFWKELESLINVIPVEIILHQSENAVPTVLAALHHGITRKDNYRAAPVEAWEALLDLAKRCSASSSDQNSRNAISQDYLFPIIRQSILLESEDLSWTIAGQPDSHHRAIQQALLLSLELSLPAFKELIQSLSVATIEQMQTSLPEQSQGFQKSQGKVGTLGARWNQLKQFILNTNGDSSVRETIETATNNEISAAMRLLKSRNGKPFGAAAMLESALLVVRNGGLDDQTTKSELEAFLTESALELFGSPSTSHILNIFHLVDKSDPSLKMYNKALCGVLKQPPSPSRTATLRYFIDSTWPSDPKLADQLSDEIRTGVHEFKNGNTTYASELEAVIANESAPHELTDEVLSKLVESLKLEETTAAGLKTISAATAKNQDSIRRFIGTPAGSGLGPTLLLLSQSAANSETRQLASDLNARTRMLSADGAQDEAAISALVDSIHEGLLTTSNASLTVDVLTGIATQLLNDTSNTKSRIATTLLVSATEWKRELAPFIARPPDASLAITNPLGGVLHWIREQNAAVATESPPPSYDSFGQSIPVRFILYTSALLKQAAFENLEAIDDLAAIIQQLSIFIELLSDGISTPATIPLWNEEATVPIDDMVETLSQIQGLLHSKLVNDSDLREMVRGLLLGSSRGVNLPAYYAARAYVSLTNELLESDPSAAQFEEGELLQIVKTPSQTPYDAARLATACQNSGKSKVANSLLADLARFDFEGQISGGIHKLTFLNCLTHSPGFDDSAFNQQHRVVLFVKHAVAAIQLEPTFKELNSELMKALLFMVPLVKDIFDNFWTDLVERLIECFHVYKTDNEVLEPALRLVSKLSALATDEETNDDLKESWSDKRLDLANALMQLLKAQSGLLDTRSQPRKIVNALLARQIDKFELQDDQEGSLFPVLSCGSFVLQRSAYKILHRSIPAAQEKVTLDAALTKDFVAKLPDGLLSLISEAPAEVSDLAGAPSLPSDLVEFLYSWKLIFDHWNGSSYQVQNDYVTAIKDGKHLYGLLDLIFEVAINSRTKPLDASKLPFDEFNPDLEESPERDCQLLICHLYLLSLLHLPALVRNWWRDECPRSLSKLSEEWTERYFSPRVVAAELGEVATWSTKQETDTPLEIKISTRAREVTAMYPIDDQVSTIRVTLPAKYPLSTIIVESINRVGVEEKKWRSWLINAQGVMNFAPSSGGIGAVTDGLVGFRRNVVGTLKGHIECAICYSIVNADRQLPTKRCGTCKNLFHGTCLFRWFRSSSGSSCPLCRTAFNF